MPEFFCDRCGVSEQTDTWGIPRSWWFLRARGDLVCPRCIKPLDLLVTQRHYLKRLFASKSHLRLVEERRPSEGTD